MPDGEKQSYDKCPKCDTGKIRSTGEMVSLSKSDGYGGSQMGVGGIVMAISECNVCHYVELYKEPERRR